MQQLLQVIDRIGLQNTSVPAPVSRKRRVVTGCGGGLYTHRYPNGDGRPWSFSRRESLLVEIIRSSTTLIKFVLESCGIGEGWPGRSGAVQVGRWP
jgi:hypothetical protein